MKLKKIPLIFVFIIFTMMYGVHWFVMTMAVKGLVPILAKIGASPSWGNPGPINNVWLTAMRDSGFSSWDDMKFWKK